MSQACPGSMKMNLGLYKGSTACLNQPLATYGSAYIVSVHLCVLMINEAGVIQSIYIPLLYDSKWHSPQFYRNAGIYCPLSVIVCGNLVNGSAAGTPFCKYQAVGLEMVTGSSLCEGHRSYCCISRIHYINVLEIYQGFSSDLTETHYVPLRLYKLVLYKRLHV